MNKTNKIFFLGTFFFISIIFSYFFSEDTIGGAKIDYNFHEKFIVLFAEDFKNTFNNYGQGELYARNSPVFYIFLSLIYKIGIDLESIRYLNIISIPLFVYIFYECLKIQFKNINSNLLIFLAFVIFLSPTVRSLVVWPYPILYGFIFFLFSVRYYLKFIHEKKFKIINAQKNTFFLALASYITPTFSVFVIFFLYKFFLGFKNKKFFIYLMILNFLFATPALVYYFLNDFYLFDIAVFGVELSTKINIFNKIIIILSLILFYFIPFINKENIKNYIIGLKSLYQEYTIIIFFLICIYFFNFPSGNFGGGIFFHFSQDILNNNLPLFAAFLLSITLFRSMQLLNLNNILLFICLILYNPQVSIYHKYFDPLLLFMFLFLMSNNKIRNKTSFLKITKGYYILYLFFLMMSFYKVNFL